MRKSAAWGDYDGDLDLAVGSWGRPNRLYRNHEGTLTSRAIWSSAEADFTSSVARSDYDGDLDLAAGNYSTNRLYRNLRRNDISLENDSPYVTISRPGITDADFFSTPEILPAADIPISYLPIREVS